LSVVSSRNNYARTLVERVYIGHTCRRAGQQSQPIFLLPTTRPHEQIVYMIKRSYCTSALAAEARGRRRRAVVKYPTEGRRDKSDMSGASVEVEPVELSETTRGKGPWMRTRRGSCWQRSKLECGRAGRRRRESIV